MVQSLDVISTLNYMILEFSNREENSFVGFKPIHETDNHWGISISDDGVSFAACHVTKQTRTWGDDSKDTEHLAKLKPYVLMFLGSDNCSYFMRFETKKQAINHFNKLDVINTKANNILWYNS